MSYANAQIDFNWLARRLTTLYPSLQHTGRRADELMSEQNLGAQCSKSADVSAMRGAVDELFSLFELAELDWGADFSQESLPVLAIFPGTGIRFIYAFSGSGYWLVEGPDGSEKLHILPSGGLYAPLNNLMNSSSSPNTAIALFKSALLSHREVFVQAALASLISNILALGASLYSMQVYDRVIPTHGLSTLLVLTVGVFIAAALELLVKTARSNILEFSVKSMDTELSHKIFQRLLGIRLDQFPPSVGTLSAQLRSYEIIRGFASSATLYLAVDAPFALFFLIIIWFVGGLTLALVPLGFFSIAMLVGLYYRHRIASYAATSSNSANKKLGLLVETIDNAEIIKALGAGWQQLIKWDYLNKQNIENDVGIRRCSEHASYLSAFMQQGSYVALVGIGAWLASTTNDLTSGGVIGCSILAGRVLGPVGALPGLIVQWAHARAALTNLERVFSLERDNHHVDRPLVPQTIFGAYDFTAVKYNYSGRPGTINIDKLHIRRGEKVGVLGSVGVGKSTFLKLLAGFYRPQSGVVHIDGLDMQQISRAHLSENIAYLAQETKLVAGSLRDNLLLGLPDVGEERILKACELSGLKVLISSHPQGLDLAISEGGRGVSGGQRQLIALTRLLLMQPSVWLLDEPTAAMDEFTELLCLQVLQKSIQPDHTLILVTHKPSVLKLVERLIVLTPSGIALDGPRDLVLAKLNRRAPSSVIQSTGGVNLHSERKGVA